MMGTCWSNFGEKKFVVSIQFFLLFIDKIMLFSFLHVE